VLEEKLIEFLGPQISGLLAVIQTDPPHIPVFADFMKQAFRTMIACVITFGQDPDGAFFRGEVRDQLWKSDHRRLARIRVTRLQAPFESYLVSYREDKQRVRILRVLHGAGDLLPLLD
jgi:hypothetical protein